MRKMNYGGSVYGKRKGDYERRINKEDSGKVEHTLPEQSVVD